MQTSLFQKRGFDLFLVVALPAGLFIWLYWNELSLLPNPALMVLGLTATVISIVPNWAGTGTRLPAMRLPLLGWA